jgi:hypothetical protein
VYDMVLVLGHLPSRHLPDYHDHNALVTRGLEAW